VARLLEKGLRGWKYYIYEKRIRNTMKLIEKDIVVRTAGKRFIRKLK
jgi:hypothetical protein